MSLVVSSIQGALHAVFTDMRGARAGDDHYFCDEVAKAHAAYVASGVVMTLDDAGTAPPGKYTGTGVGTMAIDEAVLSDAIYAAIWDSSNWGNDGGMARAIAEAIEGECTKPDTVNTVTTGVCQVGPKTQPYTGAGLGLFTGAGNAAFTSGLVALFYSMRGVTSGGDDILADGWGSLFDAYLKAGMIQVKLVDPMKGVATGGIS